MKMDNVETGMWPGDDEYGVPVHDPEFARPERGRGKVHVAVRRHRRAVDMRDGLPHGGEIQWVFDLHQKWALTLCGRHIEQAPAIGVFGDQDLCPGCVNEANRMGRGDELFSAERNPGTVDTITRTTRFM